MVIFMLFSHFLSVFFRNRHEHLVFLVGTRITPQWTNTCKAAFVFYGYFLSGTKPMGPPPDNLKLCVKCLVMTQGNNTGTPRAEIDPGIVVRTIAASLIMRGFLPPLFICKGHELITERLRTGFTSVHMATTLLSPWWPLWPSPGSQIAQTCRVT